MDDGASGQEDGGRIAIKRSVSDIGPFRRCTVLTSPPSATLVEHARYDATAYHPARIAAQLKSLAVPLRRDPERLAQEWSFRTNSNSEKKIDGIETRLSSVESLLRQTLDSLTSVQDKPIRSSMNTPASSLGGQRKTPAPARVATEEEAFEGFTSTNAHSQVATNIVEQTLGQDPAAWQDAQLHSALKSLRDLASKMQKPPTRVPTEAHVLLPTDSETEEMLSRHDMEDLLRRVCSGETLTVPLILPFLSKSRFSARCEEWYADPDNAPKPMELYISGCFYSICCEMSAMEAKESAAQHYYRLGLICERRLEKALTDVSLMMPATRENVEALIAAGSAAIDMCKPSVCFALVCLATTLAQNLGYHRYSTMTADTEPERQDKIITFWSLYLLDRSVALRLGRAPAIQDYDISLPYPSPSAKCSTEVAGLFGYWLDVARVQGKITEKLYSPGALSRPQEERFHSAAQLEVELDAAYSKRGQLQRILNTGRDVGRDTSIRESYEDVLLNSDYVMHYSILALVQYAKPASPGEPSPALDAARKALRLFHARPVRDEVNVYFWVSYCHWIIMNCPFTPSLVVFCHIISSQSSQESGTDLELLNNFVDSLKTASHVSDGVNKLYQLCSVFCNVAESYVRAKRQKEEVASQQAFMTQLPNEPANALEEFDGYLATIGLAPPTLTDGAGMADIGNPNDHISASGQDMSTYLQDWYSGNVSLLGLLEQDIGHGNFGADQAYGP